MPTNPESPQARLEVMVSAKGDDPNFQCENGETWRLEATEAVALDLLSQLDAEKARADAAEAQVKALTAERDALETKLERVDCALIDSIQGAPFDRAMNASWVYEEAKARQAARAALKLGGDPTRAHKGD